MTLLPLIVGGDGLPKMAKEVPVEPANAYGHRDGKQRVEDEYGGKMANQAVNEEAQGQCCRHEQRLATFGKRLS